MLTSSSIHCVADARYFARKRLPRMIFDYIDGAAGSEGANRLNCARIEQVRLQPRVFRNVNVRALVKTLFNQQWDQPFGIAPTGMCNLAYPGADLMLARAAKDLNIPHILSTMASTSLEAVAKCAPDQAWFQLYVGQSEALAMELVERAKASGYKTLVLTVDVPQVAPRIRDLKNGFKAPLKIGAKQFVDFALHPRWSVHSLIKGAPDLANFAPGSFDRDAKRGLVDWAFLDRLRENWQGHLIIKGVLSVEDAVRIQQAGADGIYVSNHGGRQLDSAPAAIDVLPLIRGAVGDDFPLLFDSGIRCGESVIKALALGADFVMLGRSLLYGLGADGEHGLARVFEIIENEVSVAMAQLGCTDINQLGHHNLVDL